jgi:hypothetical protein
MTTTKGTSCAIFAETLLKPVCAFVLIAESEINANVVFMMQQLADKINKNIF